MKYYLGEEIIPTPIFLCNFLTIGGLCKHIYCKDSELKWLLHIVLYISFTQAFILKETSFEFDLNTTRSG